VVWPSGMGGEVLSGLYREVFAAVLAASGPVNGVELTRLLQDLRPGLQILPRPRLTLFHQPQHRQHRTLLDPQQAVGCLPLPQDDHAPHTKKPLLIEQGLPLPQRTYIRALPL
jgi:hypothetical protein